jgi:hypothetical protein
MPSKLRHFVFSHFLMVGQSKEMTRRFLEEEEEEEEEVCVSLLLDKNGLPLSS